MTTTRTELAATSARTAAERAYRDDPTHTNLIALQIAGAAEMTEYLEGFDARHADDAQIIIEEPIADSQEHAKAEMMDRIIASFTSRPRPKVDAQRAAYNRYIEAGIAATEGHFAPLDFDAWKATMTTFLPPTPSYTTLPPIAKDRRLSPGADRPRKAARRFKS